MSVKPILAQKTAGLVQDTEDQGMAEEDTEEEDKAEGDAISKRHSDTKSVIIISNI